MIGLQPLSGASREGSDAAKFKPCSGLTTTCQAIRSMDAMSRTHLLIPRPSAFELSKSSPKIPGLIADLVSASPIADRSYKVS